MAKTSVPLVALLTLALACPVCLGVPPCQNCSDFHCPSGDTNCYYVRVFSRTQLPGMNDTQCPDHYPLNGKLLKYLTSSPVLQAVLRGVDPITIAVSPPSLNLRSACWGLLRNFTMTSAFSGGAPTALSGDRSKVAVVASINGANVSVQLVDPTAFQDGVLCEVPFSASTKAALASNTDVLASTCYELLGTCYYARIAPVNWQGAASACGGNSGKLALAKDPSEEFLMRSFVLTLNTSAWFFVQAQECSKEFVMLNASDQLNQFVEPTNWQGLYRNTSRRACISVNATGSLQWSQDPNCLTDRWLCYQSIPLTANNLMCMGQYCHAFWNFGSFAVQRATAMERCSSALPRLDDIEELRKEANLIPFANSSMRYHTGIRKTPIDQRRFYLNVNTTSGVPLLVAVNNASSSPSDHCLQMQVNSTNILGVITANCYTANASKLLCQLPNNTMASFPTSTDSRLTFFDAKAQCANRCGTCRLPNMFGDNKTSSGAGAPTAAPAGGSGLNLGGTLNAVLGSNSPDLATSIGVTTFWLDGFEYQNWTDSLGTPLYDSFTSKSSSQATDDIMAKLLYNAGPSNIEECLYLSNFGIYSNFTTYVAPCNLTANVVCRAGSSCSQPPVYNDGYATGSGWFNLTSGALVVDLMSDNCTVFNVTALGLDSSTYYGCNAPVPDSISNVLPVVFSTCEIGAGSLTWTPLANTSACRGQQCDLRYLFNMADLDNQRFLRLYQVPGWVALGSQNWFVQNRTRVEVTCLPGAYVDTANASYANQMAVSTDVYCSSDTWIFNTSFFWFVQMFVLLWDAL